MSTAQEDSPKVWRQPWFKRVLVCCAILALIAAGIEAYRRIDRYAQKTIAQEVARLPVVLEFKNPPAWLEKSLLEMILQETVSLMRSDAQTYAQFQNPTNIAVLKKIMSYYENPKNQVVRQNAWVRRVISVERVRTPTYQKIVINAEFRMPVGWVSYNNQYFLIDDEGVRLPGEYTDAERAKMGRLLVIAGIQFPHLESDPTPAAPAPGEKWDTPDAKAGQDLMKILSAQPFSHQIAAINMSNYDGRVDKLAPQIVLDTVFSTSVYWGRPANDERFYEVSLKAKILALKEIFTQYSRIDAGKPYVDIRFDQVKVPIGASNG